MNLVMCFLTATTIIVLMFFVADMDDVVRCDLNENDRESKSVLCALTLFCFWGLRGLFTVDVSSITAVYHLAERHFRHNGGDVDAPVPEPEKLEAMIAQAVQEAGMTQPAAWAYR